MTKFSLVSLLLSFAWSLSQAASEPQQCGGVGSVSCRGNLFCNYPVGTCGIADTEGECLEKPETCPTDWRPVIGCDGRLYSNDCMAAAAGVSVKHPFSGPRPDPESDLPADVGSSDRSGPDGQMLFAGKVRAEGAIERQTGRWAVEAYDHDWSDNSVRLRIRFSRSVRNSVIVATPYCSYSDHGAASVSYGYFDDRTVDFVYTSPCGSIQPSGLDFLVVR